MSRLDDVFEDFEGVVHRPSCLHDYSGLMACEVPARRRLVEFEPKSRRPRGTPVTCILCLGASEP